jgi:hypothetical protein
MLRELLPNADQFLQVGYGLTVVETGAALFFGLVACFGAIILIVGCCSDDSP